MFVDPWDSPVALSLEQFFADVYYEVALARSGISLEVFVRLLDFYARTLEGTTNWMASRGRRTGILGDLIRLELERSRPDPLVIVTFNHDLVLENEIRRLGRLAGHWCLESLYGDLGLAPAWATPRVRTFPQHEDGCDHEPSVLLLKLHGSLNWLLRTRDREPQLGTLFPSSGKKTIYVNNPVEARHVGMTITMGSGSGRTKWYGWPLIVPPIYEKQKIVGIGVLQRVWDRAREEISLADRLVILGYSLPDADFYARQMLRGAFGENDLDDVHCINPDAALAEKLKQCLTTKVVRLYQDAESYLTHG